ncbi:MAG TPA: hypothetical protein VFJ85_18880 [Acidimicrobiales bacterium]|nr:hypothetical protein [Acidimicrobiales bacterium]
MTEWERGIRAFALGVAGIFTIVLVTSVLQRFLAPSECLAYSRGRRMVSHAGDLSALVIVLLAWAALAPRPRLSWALPVVVLAAVVVSTAFAGVVADALHLDAGSSPACLRPER